MIPSSVWPTATAARLAPRRDGQPPELRPQVRPLAPTRRVRRLDQGRARPPAPLGRLAAAPLAGALVVPRAHPRPTRQVPRRRELAHVAPQLGHDHLLSVAERTKPAGP